MLGPDHVRLWEESTKWFNRIIQASKPLVFIRSLFQTQVREIAKREIHILLFGSQVLDTLFSVELHENSNWLFLYCRQLNIFYLQEMLHFKETSPP